MRAFFLLLVLILAAAGGGYWWYENNLAPNKIPGSVKAVESQLRQDAAAVGFLNIEFARKLEKYILTNEEPSVVSDGLKNDFGLLYYQLVKSGLKLQSQLNYVVSAVLAADKPEYVIALFGHFDIENLQKRLELNKYTLEQKSHKGKNYLLSSQYNEDSCTYEQAIGIYWDSNTILMGPEHYFHKLLDNLSSPKPDGSKLDRYQLVKGSILKPKSLSKGFDGALSLMLSQAARGAKPLKSIDVNARLAIYPPSVKLEASARHSDGNWAQAMVGGYTQWQTQMATQIEKHADLKNLMQSLEVVSGADSLSVVSYLDKASVFKLQQIPEQFFSVYVPKISSNKSNKPVKEELIPKTEIKKYLAKVDMDGIPVFKTETREKLSHAVVTGPFAAYLQGVRIGHNDAPQLKIGMLSADVPNLFFEDVNTKGVGRLTITDIVDKENQTLIADKECVLKNVSRQGRFEPTYRNISLDVEYGRKNATKEVAKSQIQVNLKKGVKAVDIASIKGKINLHVPTDVDVVQMSLEKDKTAYSNKKFRIKLTDIKGPSINYEVSGNKALLVDVRARNEATEYLRRTGSVSMQRLFDGGEIGAWDFAGKPKTVELVVAGNTLSQSFDFEIKSLDRHNLIPQYVKYPIVLSNQKKFSKKQFAPVSSDKCTEEEIEQSAADIKPFVLCVKYPFRPMSENEYSGVLELVGPVTPELQNNLSAVTFKLDSVALSNKDESFKVYDVKTKQVTQFTVASVGNRSTPQIKFKAPEGIDPYSAKINAVKGTISINLVKKLETVTIATNNIGKVAFSRSGIKVQYEGFEDEAYYIRIYGDEDRVVNIYGVDDQGREIKPIFPKIEYPGNNAAYTLLVADINGKPEKLVIELAKSLDKINYAFKRNNK